MLLTTKILIKTHVWLVRPDEIVRSGELCTQTSTSYIPIWQTRREFEMEGDVDQFPPPSYTALQMIQHLRREHTCVLRHYAL